MTIGKVVCVTGASGYIASWLVKFLLSRGYTVKASVRDPNDPKKTQHLVSLEGAKERLHLFKADILEEGSFDSAIDGCEGVFHTASPFYHDVKDPQAELIDPALKGTLNVLNSCAKASSVKRVVVTSSMASLMNNGKPRTPDVTVDETWWSDPELCTALKKWYNLSKTLAEEAAWKLAKEKGLDIVTLNPAMVIGPLLQPTLNTSTASILNLISGAKSFPNYTSGWVSVKDVANAHIQAFEVPSANGRYCMVESVVHHSEVVSMLRELYPNLQLPERCVDGNPDVPTYQVSKEKIKSLGIDYIPLKVGIKETVESLKEKGDPKKTQHLISLEGAKERLELFKADLLEKGSFDSAIDGCQGVFHTASPFHDDFKDPQADLIDPAVKGTLNVLNSCAKASSVKRVVVTSSMVAVTCNGKPRTPDVTVDETWFSDPEICKASKMWYALSKTLAEDAAWKLAEEKGLDIVTINPSMVIGPLLQPTLNTSAAAILNLINGAKSFPNSSFGWVNVKDIANAHIQAFEVPSANGRYCVVERVVHNSEVVSILRELYPNLQLPERCVDEKPDVPTYQVSKEKIKSLGIDCIPSKVSIKETVDSLKEKGFVHF